MPPTSSQARRWARSYKSFDFSASSWLLSAFLFAINSLLPGSLPAQSLTLQSLVTPSTTLIKDEKPVKFAIHAFIEFNSLAESFPYVESQTQRWKGDAHFDDTARQKLARDLMREAVESRVISMVDERPLEVLITHTRE